jgi:hypothetical protein
MSRKRAHDQAPVDGRARFRACGCAAYRTVELLLGVGGATWVGLQTRREHSTMVS